MIYLAFGLIAALAAVLLIRPLLKTVRGDDEGNEAEVALYRAQLAELEADAARGLLAGEQARAARTEVERRLLRAAGRPAASPAPGRAPRQAWMLALFVGLGVPVGAALLYERTGRPDLQDAPLAARLEPAGQERETAALVDRLAARMRADPRDPQGWALLGRARAAQGRFAEAAEAFEQLAALLPQDAEARLQAAQMHIAAGQGHVDPRAGELIGEAGRLAPADPAVPYFAAYARLDRGDAAGAEEDWRRLAQSLPADEPLRAQALAGEAEARQRQGKPPQDPGAAAPPGPAQDDAAGIAALPPEERRKAVEAMVEGLAKRLEAQPEDLDGWTRLARAYEMLGRREDAAAAWERAARLKPDDPAPAAQAARLRAAP